MEGNKNNTGLVIVLIIFIVLSVALGGYLVYDKLSTQPKENENEEKVEDLTEEKKYTYEEMAGNYYYEISAGIEEIPSLMDRFYLLLSEDGTFSYSHVRQASVGVIGNYMIDGNGIKLNYIGSTNNGAGIGEILDKSHTLIINDDKSLTDEKIDLGTVFSSKITLIKDGKPSQVGSNFSTFDEILRQELNNPSINY